MDFEKLVVPFGADTKELIDGLEKASTKAEAFTSKLAGIGKAAVIGAVGAVTTGVAALTGVIATSIGKTNEWAGEMDGIQDILGGTNKEAAGLALLMKRVGGNTEQVTGAIKKMAMGLNDLDKDGFSKTEKSLKKLGISLKDTNGKMKDSYQIFAEVSDVVAEMPDGLEKDAILMDLFGKSGAELGDALSAAANGGMKDFQEEATKMGLAIDPQRAIAFQQAQQRLNDTFNGLWVTLGNKLMPALTTLLNWFTDFIQSPEVQNFLNPIIDKIGKVIEAFANGAAEGGIFQGVLDAMREAGLGNVADALLEIYNKFVEVKTFVQAELLPKFAEIWTSFDTEVIQPMKPAIKGIQDDLGGIPKAVAEGDWEAVGKSLQSALDKMQIAADAWMKDKWGKIWNFKITPEAEKAAYDAGYSLAQWLFNGFQTGTKDSGPNILQTMFLTWSLIRAQFLAWLITMATDFVVGFVGAFLDKWGDELGLDSAGIKNIKDGLHDSLIWAFKFAFADLLGYLQDPFKMVVDAFNWWVNNGIKPALDSLGGAFDRLGGRIDNLKNKLAGLSLPSWLTPGSPTPLELGILGINDALKKINSTGLSDFNSQIDVEGNLSMNSSSSQDTSPSNWDMNQFAKLLATEIAKVAG